jgi:hypothetical protein
VLRRCRDVSACRYISYVPPSSLDLANQALDNLAFITRKRLGRNTNLEHSRFSLLLGNSQLFLLYDEILILKGEGDEEPSFAMNGLLETSMAVVSKYMKQLSYPY